MTRSTIARPAGRSRASTPRRSARSATGPSWSAAEAAALRPEGSAAGTWIGLETACTACHEDFHKGKFGNDCTTCHTSADWKTIVEDSFDHARTDWPLRGAHADVKCATCHDEQLAWGKRPPHARCDDCHQDAHAGTARLAGAVVDCDACHSERWFRPSTYTVARHEEAPWKLEGKHVRVDCEKCHVRAEGADAERRFGKARVDLRPAAERCTDCHADAHAGQLAKSPSKGDCTVCHGLDGFRPARYGVAEHAKLEFPLLGRHADVECKACHGPERPGLPPMPAAAVVGPAGVDLHPGFARCADCHRDPHEGRFSPGGARAVDSDCLACHDHRSFRRTPYDVAAHAKSRFPLEGAHVAVACLDCHRELEEPRGPSTLVLGPGRAPARVRDRGSLVRRLPRRPARRPVRRPHGRRRLRRLPRRRRVRSGHPLRPPDRIRLPPRRHAREGRLRRVPPSGERRRNGDRTLASDPAPLRGLPRQSLPTVPNGEGSS